MCFWAVVLMLPSGGLAAQILYACSAHGNVVVQYFWFRHCFLLSASQMEAILGLVTAMLADRKLEVAQLAAVSLSGLLKALPAPSIQALRQQYLDTAQAIKPAKRGKLSLPASGLVKPFNLASPLPSLVYQSGWPWGWPWEFACCMYSCVPDWWEDQPYTVHADFSSNQ